LCFITPKHDNSVKIELKLARLLNYTEYLSVSVEMRTFSILRRTFSGNNTNVGILVYTMTPSNYNGFVNHSGYSATILSDGTKYRDLGTNKVNYYGQLYIVFYNSDPSMESTYLTYSAAAIPSISEFEFFELLLIIPIIIYLFIIFTKNKNSILFQNKS